MLDGVQSRINRVTGGYPIHLDDEHHKTGARGRYIPMGQGRVLPLHLVAGARSEHVSSPRREEDLSKTFAAYRVRIC